MMLSVQCRCRHNFVHDFGGEPLISMDQKDDLVEVKDWNDLVLLSHNRKEQWKNILTRQTNTNLHMMNKLAITRQTDRFEQLIMESIT